MTEYLLAERSCVVISWRRREQEFDIYEVSIVIYYYLLTRPLNNSISDFYLRHIINDQGGTPP